MSEAAPERPTRTAPPSSAGAGNAFTKKYGPLPGWGWAALAAVAAVGVWWYRSHSGASAAQAAASQDTTAATGDDIQGELATIQTEIQDLQGEESTEGGTGSGSGGGGGGKGKKTSYRHVSTGKESFNQIAKARNTSVAHIVSVSKAGPEDAENLRKLEAWANHPGTRRKGVVYYTSGGPAEGA